MCVEVLVVVAVLREEGEVGIRGAPSFIWEHRLSTLRPVADHIRDVWVLSWEEPDLDRVARSVRDEKAATGLVERGAVGRGGKPGIIKGDAAPRVVVDSRVAIGSRGRPNTN